MIKNICATLMLAILPTLVLGQSTQDPMEVCYQKPDGAVRLECFNQEMQRRHAAGHQAAAVVAAPTVSSPMASARKPVDDTVGLQGAQLHKKQREEGLAQEPVKPVSATIARLQPGPYSGYTFELDNGQSWEQAEAMPNLNVKVGDSVNIKAGVLGSFFLSTAKSQRVRVHRIR